MTSGMPRRPVDLLPSTPQRLWRWPAVLNFFLGGLGAGLYVVAAFAGPEARWLAAWLGPALVLAGFAAVATEAGRPLRGPRVLVRARTSWMSRELWLGGAFAALALADLVVPQRSTRALAVVAALGLALAQGFIVRRARAIPAWDVPVLPPLFVLSALVSGAGLLLVIAAVAGHPPAAASLGGVLVLQVAGLALWMRYLHWSGEPAFAQAVAPLAQGPEFDVAVAGGHAAPLVLTGLAVGLPAVAPIALILAGALMIAGQLHFKGRLILTAGWLRPVTLAGVRLHRRPA
jgi:formate-dependent nitrite reductase membrane component NrfD